MGWMAHAVRDELEFSFPWPCGPLLAACSPKSGPAPEPEAAAAAPEKVATVNFVKDIKPILSNKCTICHNTATLPQRPSFETREQAVGSG